MAPSAPGPDATESSAAAPAAKSASGYEALGQRMARLTTNLVATAIVLVAGLAIGRQVIAWWREAPPAAAQSPFAELPPLPEGLQMWTPRGPLQVERVVGDRPAALAALRSRCRSAGSYTLPEQPAGPGEERFVAALANQTPVEQTKELTIYEPRAELAMVVAVDRRQGRIVCWSLAIPAGEATWSCYTFRPAAAGSLTGSSDLSAGELP